MEDSHVEQLKLCDSDYRFMLIVWEHAPVNSGILAGLCLEKLGWKKSTTYTAIKKLSQKGYIKNEHAIISVQIPKERVQADASAHFVEKTFEGSLPRFLTAFLTGKTLSAKEADSIRALIDQHSGGPEETS